MAPQSCRARHLVSSRLEVGGWRLEVGGVSLIKTESMKRTPEHIAIRALLQDKGKSGRKEKMTKEEDTRRTARSCSRDFMALGRAARSARQVGSIWSEEERAPERAKELWEKRVGGREG